MDNIIIHIQAGEKTPISIELSDLIFMTRNDTENVTGYEFEYEIINLKNSLMGLFQVIKNSTVNFITVDSDFPVHKPLVAYLGQLPPEQFEYISKVFKPYYLRINRSKIINSI